MSYDSPKSRKTLKLGFKLLLLLVLLSQLMAAQAVKLLKNQNGPCEQKFCRADH